MAGRNALKIVQGFFPQVTSVHDSQKNIAIEVTEHDAQHSEVRKHRTCAMAVACKRKLKVDGVIISVDRAYLIKGSKAMRFSLPESVSREVVSFDRKGGFAPGTYKLQAIPAGKRLGHHTGGTNPHHRGNGRPHKSIHITEGVRTHLGSKDVS